MGINYYLTKYSGSETDPPPAATILPLQDEATWEPTNSLFLTAS
ncbi:MAG: hypothetical protein JWM44_1236 [Bacilli bacterium]|nr:hypothetical protein [Bacilli bacterium]